MILLLKLYIFLFVIEKIYFTFSYRIEDNNLLFLLEDQIIIFLIIAGCSCHL